MGSRSQVQVQVEGTGGWAVCGYSDRGVAHRGAARAGSVSGGSVGLYPRKHGRGRGRVRGASVSDAGYGSAGGSIGGLSHHGSDNDSMGAGGEVHRSMESGQDAVRFEVEGEGEG